MTAPPVPDPYQILGVTAEASDDDLDHAFRGLIRQHHPDTRTPAESGPEADQRLQELLTAYATLRDPIRRVAYDRTRTSKPAPPVPQFTTEKGTRATTWVESALRVGPMRWEPLPRKTPP